MAKIFFPWSSHFETGVQIIDEQHQHLFSLLNEVAEYLDHQQDIQEFERILNELTDYAVYHFQTEEEFWALHLQNGALEAEHQRAHAGFVERVQQLREQGNDKQPSNVIREILSFLAEWLAFHILENDLRLAKIVHGLQSGLSLMQAKKQANQEITSVRKIVLTDLLPHIKPQTKRDSVN